MTDEDYGIIEPSAAEQYLWPEATQNYVRDLEARIEELEAGMAKIREVASLITSDPFTFTPDEILGAMTSIANAAEGVIEQALKVTEDDG